MTKNSLEKFRKAIKEFKKGKYILLAGNMPTGIKTWRQYLQSHGCMYSTLIRPVEIVDFLA